VTNANPPILDTSQDWFLDSASENGTHTELVFHRAFETVDVVDDHAITVSLSDGSQTVAKWDGVRFIYLKKYSLI